MCHLTTATDEQGTADPMNEAAARINAPICAHTEAHTALKAI